MRKNVLIIFTSILLMSCIYSAYEMLVPAQKANTSTEIEIPKGATYRQAVEILSDEKLIRDKKIFLLLGRLTGSDRKIRAGYYSIWAGMSPLDIFKVLRKGQIIEYEIKILEGDSLFEIAEAFARTGIITREAFIKLSDSPGLLSAYNIKSPSIEGYIFPDTYLIPKGMSAEEALGTMINRMREKYSSELLKSAGAGMSENDVLTLASIIEKEAVVDSERSLISAVYLNRLKKKIPLQADPTSIYGVKSSKETITKADLQRKTPYNTYVIRGLPPGPIASPGLKSIQAALHPADVPYLYFVSRDDRTHQFSTTIDEHTAAVRLYRERKRELKDSSKEGINTYGTS